MGDGMDALSGWCPVEKRFIPIGNSITERMKRRLIEIRKERLQQRGQVHEPQTAEEWQKAVDSAQAMIALAIASDFRFITGLPTIHPERCWEILHKGYLHGFVPADKGVLESMREFLEFVHRKGGACG